jgi:hypothetical protein
MAASHSAALGSMAYSGRSEKRAEPGPELRNGCSCTHTRARTRAHRGTTAGGYVAAGARPRTAHTRGCWRSPRTARPSCVHHRPGGRPGRDRRSEAHVYACTRACVRACVCVGGVGRGWEGWKKGEGQASSAVHHRATRRSPSRAGCPTPPTLADPTTVGRPHHRRQTPPPAAHLGLIQSNAVRGVLLQHSTNEVRRVGAHNRRELHFLRLAAARARAHTHTHAVLCGRP